MNIITTIQLHDITYIYKDVPGSYMLNNILLHLNWHNWLIHRSIPRLRSTEAHRSAAKAAATAAAKTPTKRQALRQALRQAVPVALEEPEMLPSHVPSGNLT